MLNLNDTVLAVIDIQGKLAQLMHEKETLFANVERMIQGAQALELPILWTEQVPEKLGPTTPQLAGLLAQNTQALHKVCFSCYGNDDFLTALQATGRTTVLVTGIETHICVYQTTRDLLSAGYGVEVVQDAVSSRIEDNKLAGLARMKDLGAVLTTTEMSLFELLGTAEAAQFRTISRLVK